MQDLRDFDGYSSKKKNTNKTCTLTYKLHKGRQSTIEVDIRT